MPPERRSARRAARSPSRIPTRRRPPKGVHRDSPLAVSLASTRRCARRARAVVARRPRRHRRRRAGRRARECPQRRVPCVHRPQGASPRRRRGARGDAGAASCRVAGAHRSLVDERRSGLRAAARERGRVRARLEGAGRLLPDGRLVARRRHAVVHDVPRLLVACAADPRDRGSRPPGRGAERGSAPRPASSPRTPAATRTRRPTSRR